MERVVASIVVPCSYVVHGCADVIAYHQKEQHEATCPHAPYFCPEKGCGFAAGTTEALLDHFAAAHEWPTTQFQYYVPFDVPVKAGVHVLHGGEDGHLFVLHIALLDSSPLHGVSLVCVEPHARESKFGCSIGFSWSRWAGCAERRRTGWSSLQSPTPSCPCPSSLRPLNLFHVSYFLWPIDTSVVGAGLRVAEQCPTSFVLLITTQGSEQEMEVQQQYQQEGECSGAKRRKVAVAAANVTMDLAILNCYSCSHLLRPPIFQCTLGHTICSSCHNKLPDKCPFCSLPSVYNRCHMVEDLIESVKVACSNANRGCTARLTHYQKEEHDKCCPHEPCYCPETGCDFSGPTVKLVEHFSGKHKWPCAKITYKKPLWIRIKVGSTILVCKDGRLFLVNMTLDPHGAVISVCCVQPRITDSRFKCRLSYTFIECSQTMEFLMSRTNLSNGVTQVGYLFLVPDIVLRGKGERSTVMLDVMLTPQ